jgi:hypothetical protein
MTEITPPPVDRLSTDSIQATQAPSSRIPLVAPDAPTRRKWLPTLAGPLIYVVLSFALTANSWSDPTRTVIGQGGDPISELWALQWSGFAIGHGYNPFFSNFLIAPSGINLMWSGSSGPGILLAPFFLAFGPVLVYNLMLTLSLALSAWCAQLAIFRVVPSRPGAIVGGLIYGFSPYMVGHAWAHIAITIAFLPPLMLIVLHETFVRQRWRWWATGAFAGLLLAIQYTTFIETIAITALACSVVTVLLVAQRPREVRARARYTLQAGVATVVTFLVASAYPLWTMLFGGQRLGRGTVKPADEFVTDIVNFIVPTFTTKFLPGALSATSFRITNGFESGAYIGIPLIAICILTTVLLWRQIVVRTAALTGLIFAVLSLGPRLHVDGTILNVPLPFALLSQFPLIGNALASRLVGVTDLCVGVLVAAFVAHLATVGVLWRWLGIALTALGIILIIPTQLPAESYSVPSYFTGNAVKQIAPGTTVLVAPYETQGSQAPPEVWQAASGFRFRMPEGYAYVPTPTGPITGPIPTLLGEEMIAIDDAPPGSAIPQLSPAERAEFLAQMRAWHVTTVLVGPMPNYKLMTGFFQQLLGRAGDYRGGVTAWYNVRS